MTCAAFWKAGSPRVSRWSDRVAVPFPEAWRRCRRTPLVPTTDERHEEEPHGGVGVTGPLEGYSRPHRGGALTVLVPALLAHLACNRELGQCKLVLVHVEGDRAEGDVRPCDVRRNAGLLSQRERFLGGNGSGLELAGRVELLRSRASSERGPAADGKRGPQGLGPLPHDQVPEQLRRLEVLPIDLALVRHAVRNRRARDDPCSVGRSSAPRPRVGP